jgi:hypothetical protein
LECDTGAVSSAAEVADLIWQPNAFLGKAQNPMTQALARDRRIWPYPLARAVGDVDARENTAVEAEDMAIVNYIS